VVEKKILRESKDNKHAHRIGGHNSYCKTRLDGGIAYECGRARGSRDFPTRQRSEGQTDIAAKQVKWKTPTTGFGYDTLRVAGSTSIQI